jgi:diaminopimelate decarboxylase
VRPPGVRSRFGIDFDRYEEVTRLLGLMRRLPPGRPFAVHFHVPSAVVGRRAWRGLAGAMVDIASQLEALTGRSCLALDTGGGWYPEDFAEDVAWIAGEFADHARDRLRRLERLVLEPGRALVQDAVAVLTTVLEVRRRTNISEAVVDTSLAELSEATHFPHRALYRRSGRWSPVASPGADRVLGRTCMEADVLLSWIRLPPQLAAGDRILILDAGGYDRSMAYDFAQG